MTSYAVVATLAPVRERYVELARDRSTSGRCSVPAPSGREHASEKVRQSEGGARPTPDLIAPVHPTAD